tara:strand:- start:4969 stop:5676 length:708 start_codon:yes stop_codon:yes gene_type:complete
MAVGLRKNTKNEKKDSPMRIFGDLFGGRSLRKKLAKAEEEYKSQMKEYRDFTFKNPFAENVFANMENTMEDLTINQQQAEFQRQQAQQSQANILQSLTSGGEFNAGNIQALANQADISAQRASASIGQQEASNRMARAREASRLQTLERQGMQATQRGASMVQGMEFDRQATMLGMSMEMVGNAQDAIAANKAMWGNIIGSVVGAAAGGFVSGGMTNLGEGKSFFGKELKKGNTN